MSEQIQTVEDSAADQLWLEPRVQALQTVRLGPYARLMDGTIVGVQDGLEAALSEDDGVTWSRIPMFSREAQVEVSRERALIVTRKNTLVLAFMNLLDRVWTWDSETSDITTETRLPTCVMRSVDGGRTWQDFQLLHSEWTGAIRNMIQTHDGTLVFTSMMMLAHPGRHSVVTYRSTDDGLTWQRSNIIDLGGIGHHGGVTEATVEQLRDGRLWLLLRTNWGRFWEAFSEDDGASWRVIRPSTIAASSAPGLLKRLASGQLMLLWNRLYPEGRTAYALTGGDNQWSEVPCSNHREELSVAFSTNDGATWTRPVTIARQSGAWLSYPYAFEVHPGELWITTMQGDVRVKLREEAFANEPEVSDLRCAHEGG